MRALPLDIGLIHFVGIGGIGMSGIAEVLHNLGYKVQGSDVAEGANTRRLADLGIKVAIGHRADNVGNATVVVVSSAVKKDNPEVLAARSRLVPVVRRAEMLGELMRLKWSIAIGGTHGKTTTTSMVAAMLDAGGLDPTVINGGIINAYGTNARIGGGDWMVVESDESDGSFLRLPATIAIVTNVDPEHLDHYGTFDALRDAFVRFVENIPFYGFAVLCADHPEVQALIPRVSDRRIITYGLGVNADVRAMNLKLDRGGADFDVLVANRTTNESRMIEGLRLPMYGQHNVQNALAAIAAAGHVGIAPAVALTALAKFKGVKRRLELRGELELPRFVQHPGHFHDRLHIRFLERALHHAGRGIGGGRTLRRVQQGPALGFQSHRIANPNHPELADLSGLHEIDRGRPAEVGAALHAVLHDQALLRDLLGGVADEGVGALEPAVEPAERGHLQVLRVLVRAFGDEEAEFVRGFVQAVDAGDVAVHAQHAVEEFEAKRSWGHCTNEYALRVARESGARCLALFHHCPTHGDDMIDRMLRDTRDLACTCSGPEVIASTVASTSWS